MGVVKAFHQANFCIFKFYLKVCKVHILVNIRIYAVCFCSNKRTSSREVNLKENVPVTRFLFICPPKDPSICTILILISSKDGASLCKF